MILMECGEQKDIPTLGILATGGIKLQSKDLITKGGEIVGGLTSGAKIKTARQADAPSVRGFLKVAAEFCKLFGSSAATQRALHRAQPRRYAWHLGCGPTARTHNRQQMSGTQ
jgi:hypothetical protein